MGAATFLRMGLPYATTGRTICLFRISDLGLRIGWSGRPESLLLTECILGQRYGMISVWLGWQPLATSNRILTAKDSFVHARLAKQRDNLRYIKDTICDEAVQENARRRLSQSKIKLKTLHYFCIAK